METPLNRKSDSVQGRCFCGSIRFEILFPTDFCSHCHCESCRRSHGSAFVTWTSVPIKQFKFISGADLLRKYRSSPEVSWCFCDTCGASLLYEHTGTPEKIYMTVANLEGPLDRPIDGHVSYEERVDWLHVGDDLPKYREKSSEQI